MIPRIITVATIWLLALDAVILAWLIRSWAAAAAGVVIAGGGLILVRLWWRPRQGADGADGLRLGAALDITDPDHPVELSQTVIPFGTLNLGVLALGSPGAGKTVLMLAILQSYAKRGGGWAYFEGKGDLDIYLKACACGAEPDYFFSSELDGSGTVNLMAGEPFDVIDRLSRILVGHTASTTFYADEQRAVLSRVVPVLLGLGEPVNLRDLYAMLEYPAAAADVLRRAVVAGVPDDQIEMCAKWYRETDEGDRKALLKGMMNKLYTFVATPTAQRLNAYRPTIDIADCVKTGKSVYWHFPLSEYSRDVAIAVIEIYSVEARRRQQAGADGAPSHPQIFDDWGAFFHDGFGPYSARCRSVNMPLFFSFQSRAMLQEVAPTFADILDDTTATKIVMRLQGTASARYARELLGEYERLEVGVSQLGERDGTSMQIRETSRVSGEQLREQDGGGAFVSTLTADSGGATRNALWAVRVPMPDYQGWASHGMPPPIEHCQGDGLDLWGTYVSPSRRREKERAKSAATADEIPDEITEL